MFEPLGRQRAPAGIRETHLKVGGRASPEERGVGPVHPRLVFEGRGATVGVDHLKPVRPFGQGS